MDLDETQRASQEQFGRQSRNYGAGHILADTSDVAAALEWIDLPACADVLDVACGAGHTGLHLAGLGHRLTFADLAEPMLALAEEAAIERGYSVATKQHAAEDLPYEGGSFDLVTCRVATHHFSDPGAFLMETARVLRPGGWFLAIDGSVDDDAPEADAWMHAVEKFRDPSHGRFLTPGTWRELCDAAGLTVRHWALKPMKQPDLEWYFETANTSEENRKKVLALVANAPEEARRLFKIGEEDGKIVWWWRRLTLVAQR